MAEAPKVVSNIHGARTESASPRELTSAELRLRGAIKRGASRRELTADAERVRHTKLMALKASRVRMAFPTEVDDAMIDRRRANLDADEATWRTLTVDEIIARYTAPTSP